MDDNREMFEQINALIGAVAKALDISEIEVVTAIEQGRLGMELQEDERGKFVAVDCDGRQARVYHGAVWRPDDQPPAEDSDDGCGGGCSCGH